MTQTTTIIPEDLREIADRVGIVEKTLDDAQFLSAILDELDKGWVTGAMCDMSGRKCLVGAGAAALGLDYGRETALRQQIRQIWDDAAVRGVYDDPAISAAVAPLNDDLRDAMSLNNGFETAAAKRLATLLEEDIVVYYQGQAVRLGVASGVGRHAPMSLEDIMEDTDDNPVDIVTSFNDDGFLNWDDTTEGDDDVSLHEKTYPKLREVLVRALVRARENV